MGGKTKALRMTQVVVLLMLVASAFAADPVETIDARARGTSTQMGKDIDIKVIINQYSTSEDRQMLVDAFKKGGSDGLARALFKMKSVGRLSIPGTVGYTIAFARAIPTPTGRKVRFVTNRKLAFGEQARNTRSESYDLTAGEIDINDQDKSKSTGVLYPAAQLGVNQDGELQFNLYQNPWQLVNILDWTSKGKG
jgi:hypothetical protein